MNSVKVCLSLAAVFVLAIVMLMPIPAALSPPSMRSATEHIVQSQELKRQNSEKIRSPVKLSGRQLASFLYNDAAMLDTLNIKADPNAIDLGARDRRSE